MVDECYGDVSTVALLAEQTEADENENQHKKKHDHDHPQLAERQPSKTWHAQIIVEGDNERNGDVATVSRK
jgi:hypothetical protein